MPLASAGTAAKLSMRAPRRAPGALDETGQTPSAEAVADAWTGALSSLCADSRYGPLCTSCRPEARASTRRNDSGGASVVFTELSSTLAGDVMTSASDGADR
jgi:hypothetical protein